MNKNKALDRWKRRLRLVRRPHDASTEFDDTAYDGGVSGGAYARHIVIGAVVVAMLAGLWAWASGHA